MRKNYSILSILLMVTLVGCTRTEFATQEREITFSVARYATQTKSSPLSVDGITSFQSRGFLHAEGVDGVQDFFGASGETITYNGSDLWTPTHNYYWPKHENSYINFVSWYANNGIAPSTVSETSFIITREVAATDNILIADEAWRYNANTTNATQYNNDNITVGVPTMFHHVLSRVQFNVRAYRSDDPDDANVTYQVILQSASLNGIFRRGTITLTNSAKTETGTREWYSIPSPTTWWETAAGSNQTPFTLVSSNLTLGTQASTILEMRSFMPQVLGNTATLSLTYTIVAKSNNVEVSRECDIPATIVLNTIVNGSNVNINQWLPNRKYTYIIAINPVSQEIVLNPVVEDDWDDYATTSAVVE